MVEKQVARCDLRSVAAQDDHASQSARRRGGGCLPGMVRLHRAERHERVGVPAQRLGYTELELARLVAARGEAGLVVALHEQARAPERPGQPGHLMERGGEVAEANAREPVREHGRILIRR